MRAINEVQINYYLIKPWDPPEERLYPVLDDLLEDWLATFRPPFDGVRLVGHRWSAASHQLKDFLGRNQIPYQWLDVEVNEEARGKLEAAGPSACLPLVVLPDGAVLQDPSIAEVAARIGMAGRAELPYYDLVVVGAGPAGLAAAVYGASEGLHTLLVEAGSSRRAGGHELPDRELPRVSLWLVRGRPGAPGTDSGKEAWVRRSSLPGGHRTPRGGWIQDLSLGSGDEVSAKALLLSGGVSYRRLNAPGVVRFTDAGIYYGAACRRRRAVAGEDIYIIGGANSAGQAAVFFSAHARTVTV